MIPKVLTTAYMIFYVVKLLNFFPAKKGSSDFYSLKVILSGKMVHYKFYVMLAHTAKLIRKTCHTMIVWWHAHREPPRPSGNLQEGHIFLSTETSKVIIR